MPTELVRIRDKNTNTEFSVGRRRAEQLVERGAEIVKDGDAADRLGRSLPATDTTTDTTTKTAKTSKEQAR